MGSHLSLTQIGSGGCGTYALELHTPGAGSYRGTPPTHPCMGLGACHLVIGFSELVEHSVVAGVSVVGDRLSVGLRLSEVAQIHLRLRAVQKG